MLASQSNRDNQLDSSIRLTRNVDNTGIPLHVELEAEINITALAASKFDRPVVQSFKALVEQPHK